MAKLLPIEEDGKVVGYLFDCPGCGMSHAPYVNPHRNVMGASWTFNGDLDKPTFTPSILVRTEFPRRPDKASHVCHSYVTDGRIRFLSDCTHELAGREVELEDMD